MTAPPGLIKLGAPPKLGDYLRSIWARRELAASIPLGELKAQNQDTVLGGLWHLLNPLLLVLVYYLVFGLILRIGDRGTDNFIAFLSTGIFTFFFTRKSIQSGAKSIVSNLGLIRSIQFPRVILPIAAVLGETLAMGPAVATMFAVVLLTGEQPRFMWLLALPIFAVQAVFNLGLAMGVARLTDHFHDVQQLIPYLMTIWMYLSGLFYDVDAFVTNPIVLLVFKANPAYAFIQLIRDALLDGSTDPGLWLVVAGWTVASFAAGFVYFRAREGAYGRG